MKKLIRIAVAAAAIGGALGGAATAGAQPAPSRTITVVAEGEARAEPDVAFLNAGVQADGATAREALGRANEQMERVLAALRGAGVPPEDIRTSGFNVFPQMDPREISVAAPPGVPVPAAAREPSFRAFNSVNVTLRDLSRVNAVLDALLEAGITNLGGLRFGIQDTTALHARALAEAIRQARPLAEAAAQAAGLTLGEIDSISETFGGGGPAGDASAAQRGGGPIEPGSLTLQVRVQVTFRVAG